MSALGMVGMSGWRLPFELMRMRWSRCFRFYLCSFCMSYNIHQHGPYGDWEEGFVSHV